MPIQPDLDPPEPPKEPERVWGKTWEEDLSMQLARVPDEIFVDMLSRSGLTKQQQRDLIESFRRIKR
jgi:hypothetical protein